MRIDPIDAAAIRRSVIAVPPLARDADLMTAPLANAALLRHLEAGGIRSVLYGGNANFYHVGVGEYGRLLRDLADAAGPDTWILPSVGPDYGKAMDQAAILRDTDFPTAMLLPMTFPFSASGLAEGIRRFTDAFGRPAIVYIKAEPYIDPDALAALVEEGRVCAVKYAVNRPDPADDPYLDALVAVIDRGLIVSGNGERPVLAHLVKFGLNGFTSGSACLAPRMATALLGALQRGEAEAAEAIRRRILPMEDLRDELGPIPVLHDAVSLAGLAEMGPMLPMMSNLSEDSRARIGPVAKMLSDADATFQERDAA